MLEKEVDLKEARAGALGRALIAVMLLWSDIIPRHKNFISFQMHPQKMAGAPVTKHPSCFLIPLLALLSFLIKLD